MPLFLSGDILYDLVDVPSKKARLGRSGQDMEEIYKNASLIFMCFSVVNSESKERIESFYLNEVRKRFYIL